PACCLVVRTRAHRQVGFTQPYTIVVGGPPGGLIEDGAGYLDRNRTAAEINVRSNQIDRRLCRALAPPIESVPAALDQLERFLEAALLAIDRTQQNGQARAVDARIGESVFDGLL